MKQSLSKAFRPIIEALEDRLTPAATLHCLPVNAVLNTGVLTMVGTNGNDIAAVNPVPGSSAVKVTINAGCRTFTNVQSIVFSGLDGNDIFQNNTAIQSTARGGNGDDKLYGGFGLNFMHGDGGNDKLVGAGTANFMFGGDNDDYLLGSANRDILVGDAGNDTLVGNAGDDTLIGGIGKDLLAGGLGNDILNGGDDQFADYLNGGRGRDSFQVEGYSDRNGVFHFNLDDPADYNPAEDIFFGEDPPSDGGIILLATERTSRT